MKNKSTKLFVLALLTLIVTFGSSLWGAVDISFISSLLNPNSLEYHVLTEIRIPRVLLAVLLGGSLAWSGVIVQTLFRNPIVEPGLVGITAGSSLAAAVGIVLGHNFVAEISVWLVTTLSFIGGIVVCFLIFIFSRSNHKTEIYSLLLIGISINALCFSGIGFLSYIANEAQLRSLSTWNLGSLSGSNWEKIKLFFGFLIFPIFVSPFLSKKLNILSLGESEANHLGLSVESFKILLIVFVGISVGASISLAGNIGFVGLAVPHIMRLYLGQNHSHLLLASYFGGGILLTISDTICRTIVSPSEIPVGILTAMIGAPIFLHLLKKRPKL